MDAGTRQWLYDPATTTQLVLARRPPIRSVVRCVVSDVVWADVVRLLRWADAGSRGAGVLEAGTWWRLAAACAELLRRLPGLCAEIGEPWSIGDGPAADPEGTGEQRVRDVAGRLAAQLRCPEPLPLHVLAGEVDALGAAAVSALAELTTWTSGDAP